MQENIKDKIKEEELEPGLDSIIEDDTEDDSVNPVADGDTLTPSDDGIDESQGDNEVIDEPSNPEPEMREEAPEKMLTQSQVNELVGKARQEGRDSAMKELISRYGVNDDNELNDLFGKGQVYGVLDEEYQNQGNSYRDALAENALLKSKIDENRFEDVKLILGGKGLEVNVENIESLIPSHPEWRGSGTVGGNTPEMITPEKMDEITNRVNETPLPKSQPSTLRKLGNEASPEPEESEEEKARKIYGF